MNDNMKQTLSKKTQDLWAWTRDELIKKNQIYWSTDFFGGYRYLLIMLIYVDVIIH
jgi:hypothetical protein